VLVGLRTDLGAIAELPNTVDNEDEDGTELPTLQAPLAEPPFVILSVAPGTVGAGTICGCGKLHGCGGVGAFCCMC
jgi:hypothetical protein